MKINKENSMLECLHLDPAYMGLTVQNLMTISEGFNLLDVHSDQLLNDLQVKIWMKHNTDLKQSEVVTIFELIDICASGFFDFEMFYFFCSIIICAKDHLEKDFINRHSRSIYNLFETRMRGKMTHEQFVMVGWLFGYEKRTINFFHKEFDVSKSKKIPYDEFKLYALICIEVQDMIDGRERILAFQQYRQRLVMTLKDKLVKYVKYDTAPPPSRLTRAIRWVQRPYVWKGRGIHRLNPFQRCRKSLSRRWIIFTEDEDHSRHQRRSGCCSANKQNKKIHPHHQQKKKMMKIDEFGRKKKCSLIRCFQCCNNKVADTDTDMMMTTTKKRRGQEDGLTVYSQMPSWILKLDQLKRNHSRHKSLHFEPDDKKKKKSLVIETKNPELEEQPTKEKMAESEPKQEEPVITNLLDNPKRPPPPPPSPPPI